MPDYGITQFGLALNELNLKNYSAKWDFTIEIHYNPLEVIERSVYIRIRGENMARPIEYDQQIVLDKAMELFWRNSFEGTSVAELVEATGLNKRTMYNLYDDKQGLFDACLGNYLQKYLMMQIGFLKNNRGVAGIRQIFSAFEFRNDFIGCLYVNTAMEKHVLQASSLQIVKNYYNTLKNQVIVNLEQAREDGDFTGDSMAVSLTLLCLAQGINVSGHLNSSDRDCKLIVETILTLVK